jgi:hypothetical protein
MYTVGLLPQIHGRARITESRSASISLTVETEDPRWSFAASFALAQLPSLEGSGEPRAIVDIEVEIGAIGLGCVTADYSSFLDREVTVPAGVRRKAFVPIGAAATVSHLVLRNVSADGSSKARIYGIEIKRISATEELSEQLRCSGPIGPATPHGGGVVQAFGARVTTPAFQPVLLETDAAIYSNAASFALTLPPVPDPAAEPWLVVDLQVETGAVWVGCTTADYASYVDREAYVPAGIRCRTYVSLGSRRNACHAMFRNDSLDGRSVLRIYGMEIRNVSSAESEDAQLRSLDALCLHTSREEIAFQRSEDSARNFRGGAERKGSIDLGATVGHRETDPRMGGMATMPSRSLTFERALASILPQVDRLYVYFDKHAEVPEAYSNHPKIVPLLPSKDGEWAACGKLLGLKAQTEPCLYFCLDDDILYPPDYVEVMTQALKRHDWQAIVGVHASRLKTPYLSYRRDRDVVEFRQPLAVDCCFDILGTGTIAFHTEAFCIDPSDWRYHDMVDLMVAIEAAKCGLPRISIRRPKNYLRPLDRQQPDSIYVRLAGDDTRETAIMREALRSCSLSWAFSPVAPRDHLGVTRPDTHRFIDTIHGVIAGADGARFTHGGLIDTERLVAQLRERERPYVPLAASLRGEGASLTIDDSTVAARDAARLARQHGHAVTLFLNGYNISERVPYHFSRLSAVLDSTELTSVYYEGYDHDLQTTSAKQRFRSLIKRRIDQIGADPDRQNFVSEIAVLLGVGETAVPRWLAPITIEDVRELAGSGVDIQNHGWTHTLVGALPPEEYAANIRRGRDWLCEVCGTKADFFAVPNGDGLPLWETSPHYSAWILLDPRRPFGELAPGVYNRGMLAL